MHTRVVELGRHYLAKNIKNVNKNSINATSRSLEPHTLISTKNLEYPARFFFLLIISINRQIEMKELTIFVFEKIENGKKLSVVRYEGLPDEVPGLG